MRRRSADWAPAQEAARHIDGRGVWRQESTFLGRQAERLEKFDDNGRDSHGSWSSWSRPKPDWLPIQRCGKRRPLSTIRLFHSRWDRCHTISAVPFSAPSFASNGHQQRCRQGLRTIDLFKQIFQFCSSLSLRKRLFDLRNLCSPLNILVSASLIAARAFIVDPDPAFLGLNPDVRIGVCRFHLLTPSLLL